MSKKRVNLTIVSLSIILLIVVVSEVRADGTVDYVIKDDASYNWITAANTITTLTSGNWSYGYYDIPLTGWDFWFYGKRITNVRMSTNGYIRLGETAYGDGTDSSENPIPDRTDPDMMCAVYWDNWTLDYNGDTFLDTNRAMKYQVLGGAPNRVLVLEWEGLVYAGAMWSWYYYDFEILLYEGTNEIRFQYKDVSEWDATYDYGISCTIGLENKYGTRGVQYSYHTASVANNQAILFTPYHRVYGSSPSDFDNDNYSDVGVFKDTGYWRVRYSGGGSLSKLWGAKGDIPLCSDFDGDTIADVAVFKPSHGLWRIVYSATALTGSIMWGNEGDTPVPADYDGDNVDDIAVFKPYQNGVSTGLWRIQYSGGGSASTLFGSLSDIPVPGDYDGDAKADIAVYKRNIGLWRIQYSGGGSLNQFWGNMQSVPVPGDYDGDFITDIATFNPYLGLWRIKFSGGGQASIYWGKRTDSPTSLLWDWDALEDITISRDEGTWKVWRIRFSSGGGGGVYWGTKRDTPIGK